MGIKFVGFIESPYSKINPNNPRVSSACIYACTWTIQIANGKNNFFTIMGLKQKQNKETKVKENSFITANKNIYLAWKLYKPYPRFYICCYYG